VGLAEQECGKIIEKVITMDEIAVSYKTPMTKRQSMQWIMKRMAHQGQSPGLWDKADDQHDSLISRG
jgi:hypothetical protein